MKEAIALPDLTSAKMPASSRTTQVVEILKKLWPPAGVILEQILQTVGPISTVYLVLGVGIGLVGSGFLLWQGYYPLKGTLFVPLSENNRALTHINELNQKIAALEDSQKNSREAADGKSGLTPLAPNGDVIIDYKGRVTFSWNDISKQRGDYSILVQPLGNGPVQPPTEFPYNKRGGDSWILNLVENQLPFGRYVWTIKPSGVDSARGIYREFSIYPNVLSKIQTLHTLVIGTSLVPDQLFFKQTSEGNATGFEPQLIDLVVRRLQTTLGRIKVSFKYLAWDDLLPSLARHEVDVVVSSMTKTREREAVYGVRFSNGYFTTHQRFLVRSKSARCIESGTIGVVGGEPETTNQIAAKLLTKRFRFLEAKPFPTATALFQALDNGDIDAALVDDISAERNYRDSDSVEFYGPELDDLLRKEGFYESLGIGREEFAMAVPRDSEDLIRIIDDALDHAGKDGTLRALTASLLRSGLKKTSKRHFC